MHDIRASVILAECLEENSIKNIVKILQSGVENTICMYLTLKIDIQNTEELKIGFDIVRLDEKNDFGIELGEITLGKSRDAVMKETKDGKEEKKSAKKTETRKNISIQPYNIYTIRQEFPPLPVLENGHYEFVVYEKDNGENYILDTFLFDVE